MSDIDPRLAELLDAAERLVTAGSSITNRTRLRQALSAIPREPLDVAGFRPWRFTPAVMQVIARAAELADAANDLHVRIAYLEHAIKEVGH